MANEDLFAGISIMTPQELNSEIASGEGNDEGKKVDDEFQILTPEAGVEPDKTVTSPSETTDSTSTPNSNVSGNEVIYKALIKEMVDNGVLSVEEGDELEELPGTLDTIKSLMSKTVGKATKESQDAWKNSLSKSKKRFFDIEDAFDNDDLAIQMTERLEFFDTITDESLSENVDLQKSIYHQFLLGKGYTEAEAREEIADADSLDKLADKAAKALPHLKKEANDFVENSRTQKVQKQEMTKKQMEDQFNSLMTNIESRESFVDGINLNKIAKDKLKENITKPVHTDEQGRQYTSLMYKQKQNAAEFEMLINYYDTLGLFNIDKSGKFKPDISKLKAVAKTAAVNEVDKVISAESQRGVGRNTSIDVSDKAKGIFNVLEGAFGKK